MKPCATGSVGGRHRIAFHEAGHLIMALILGLEVQSCALLSNEGDWRPGELGRCTVLVPDPVGLRRFLVSMGGVMAEDHFYGGERGGFRDHCDALQALRNYLAHYRDPHRKEDVEILFRDVADFFHREEILEILERTARRLHKKGILDRRQILDIAALFPEEGERSGLRETLRRLEHPAPAPSWGYTCLNILRKAKGFILRFRKPFDEGP